MKTKNDRAFEKFLKTSKVMILIPVIGTTDLVAC